MTEREVKKFISEKTPISRIIELYNCGSFWEVTGRAGGDVLTYRIYNNGTWCER